MNPKSEIRLVVRSRIASLTSEERAAKSALLCQRLIEHPILNTARHIGVYFALPDEPDLLDAIRTFLDQGKQLSLPWPGEQDSWFFHRLDSMDITSTGPFNLPMPEKGQRIDPGDLDAILVPGRAFTSDGIRIGRGKGIYDRLLCGSRATTIGIGFACQLFPELPEEEHDIRLVDVITA